MCGGGGCDRGIDSEAAVELIQYYTDFTHRETKINKNRQPLVSRYKLSLCLISILRTKRKLRKRLALEFVPKLVPALGIRLRQCDRQISQSHVLYWLTSRL